MITWEEVRKTIYKSAYKAVTMKKYSSGIANPVKVKFYNIVLAVLAVFLKYLLILKQLTYMD